MHRYCCWLCLYHFYTMGRRWVSTFLFCYLNVSDQVWGLYWLGDVRHVLFLAVQGPSPFCEMKLIWTAGIQMKLRCDHRGCNHKLSNLLQILAQRERNFRTSTGFKPMASVLVLLCSTNWAMKTHMLGADQFIEFIFTRDMSEMWNEVDLNCGNIYELEMWSSQL